MENSIYNSRRVIQTNSNIIWTYEFTSNIIIGIEKKEGYNEVVKKVVKRLAENDLCIKLEKYK